MKPPPAQEILESELGEPILARWHVGLGWTLAWTSDVKNLWAVEWLRWPQCGQFWGQLVREHMRQKKRQASTCARRSTRRRATCRPSIDAIGARRPLPERPRREAHRSPGPQPGRRDARQVPMPQTAPGRYEADFPLDRYGSFLLHASLEKAVDDGHGRRAQDGDRRRELRPRDEPVSARVPRARARRRDARRARRRRRAAALDPTPRRPSSTPRASRSATTRTSGRASSAPPSRSSCSICWCGGCGSSTASGRPRRRERSARRRAGVTRPRHARETGVDGDVALTRSATCLDGLRCPLPHPYCGIALARAWARGIEPRSAYATPPRSEPPGAPP